MYGCERWTIKKAEHWGIDAFKLWCWRRFLRVPWRLQGDQTSQSEGKSAPNIHWKDWCWSWNSSTLPFDAKSWLIRKNPHAGKDWGQEDNGATEDEMVGWYHWLSGHEFEQTPGDSEGQEAWHAAVHRVTKSWTPLSNWTQLGDRYCCKVSFSKHNILARLAWFFRYLSCQDLERDGLHAVLTWCFVVVF